MGPDDFDDFPILHEYGHHIARLFNITALVVPPGLDAPDGQQGQGAWCEGWADFFGSQMAYGAASPVMRDWAQKTSAPGDTSVLTRNLETGVITFRDDSTFNANERGEQFIGAVFGTLWDVVDAANDNPNSDGCSDQLTDPIGQVWHVATTHPSSPMLSICDFRNLYYQDYYLGATASDRARFNSTFCEHGMVCGGTLGVDDGPVAAGGIWMSRPQPNPFHGQMTLRFRVASGGTTPAMLDLYDVAGARVARLYQGIPGDGPVEVTWDGRGRDGSPCLAGLYFARLQSGNVKETTTVVYLR
jgi:hypothetical protein